MCREDSDLLREKNTFNGEAVFHRVETASGGDTRQAWKAANSARLDSEQRVRDKFKHD